MAYKFDKIQVNKVVPQKQTDGSVALKVQLADGNRMTIPVTDDAAKKLRPGVVVTGFFSHMTDWALDGDAGEKIKGTTLTGAHIQKVEKGEYTAAELDDEINDVNWAEITPREAFAARTALPKAGESLAETEDENIG